MDATVQVAFPAITRLDAKQTLVQTKQDHPDQGVLLYIQGREKNLAEKARFLLLAEILNAPFYHSIRTRQQLGYSVFSFAHELLGWPGLAFVVQSSKTPEQVQGAITGFLNDFGAQLQQPDTVDVQAVKQSVITRMLAQQEQFAQRSNAYW